MIEIRRLEIELKNFKLKTEDISLTNGEKVLLAARNNIGKSIFLLGLTRLVRTKVRDIYFDNKHCKENQWQQHTGVYHDQTSLVPFLTPSELFRMTGEIKGMPNEFIHKEVSKYSEYLYFPKNTTKFINELSLGTQKKVGLIASLL
ncbi:MAG TPA: hypothetical protein DCF44_00980, partial [Chitinophagaceae bacterium]|nr:hypothetical protein [Chitinophagaceae bacterium]